MTKAEKTAEEKAEAAAAKKAKAEAAAAKKAEADAAEKAAADAETKEETNTGTGHVAGGDVSGAGTTESEIQNLGEALVNADADAEKSGLDAEESIAKGLIQEESPDEATAEIAPNVDVKPITRKGLRVVNASSSQLRCFVSDMVIPALGQVDIHYDSAEELQRAKDSFDKTNEISASQRIGYEDLGDI